jgi:NADH-quinone oxidoreductase subunit L
VLASSSRFGTLDFQQVASAAAASARDAVRPVSLITLLLFVGATGKSAQIPLYVWLPDAMEGPTPVSALIHAATMVTAGVYMIGRNAVLFTPRAARRLRSSAVQSPPPTAIMAGYYRPQSDDIKRVLAYSTVLALGYMYLAMGVGAFAPGIFHLYTHAFFKALIVPGFRRGDPPRSPRAGNPAQEGGLKKALRIHLLDVPDRLACDRGVPGLARFLQQGRNSVSAPCHGHTLLWTSRAHVHCWTAILTCSAVFLTFMGLDRQHRHQAPSTGTAPSTAPHPAPITCTMRRPRWRLR